MLLITGATGHTGGYLLEELCKSNKNYKIRCLIRENSRSLENLKKYDIETVYGDIEDEQTLKKAVDGVETIIHIVNIRYSPKIVKLAQAAGVTRVILIHTTGMYSQYRSYAQEYERIEEDIINNCKIQYVILRPTMIYGSKRDHNMHKLVQYIKTHRIFPVFGNGEGLMQPVHARDLAKAIKLVLETRQIANKGYNISGGSVLKYKEILTMIAKRVNPKIRIIYIPYSISIILGTMYNILFNIMGRKAQISIEQIRRLSENKSYSFDEAKRDFGYLPITFEEGIEEEIKSLGY